MHLPTQMRMLPGACEPTRKRCHVAACCRAERQIKTNRAHNDFSLNLSYVLPATATVPDSNHTRDTMSNLEVYQYTRLPTGKYTRVIRLLPSLRFKSPIRIIMDVVSLEPLPEYEALSYAWEGQTPDQPIDCGGRRLLVTQTCLNALRRLRRKLHPRTLWIDGICIDQKTTEEKNHQVALMGPIYSSAQRVVIWLGEGRDNALLFRLPRYVFQIWKLDSRASDRWKLNMRASHRCSEYMNSLLLSTLPSI